MFCFYKYVLLAFIFCVYYSYSEVTGFEHARHITPTTSEQILVSHTEFGTSDYQSNTNTCWTAHNMEGYNIKLLIDTFSLENHTDCSFDALTIYSGSAELGRYCGEEIFASAIFSCNFTLHFTTDISGVSRGFKLRYVLIKADNNRADMCSSETTTPIPSLNGMSTTTNKPNSTSTNNIGSIAASIISLLMVAVFLTAWLKSNRKRDDPRCLQEERGNDVVNTAQAFPPDYATVTQTDPPPYYVVVTQGNTQDNRMEPTETLDAHALLERPISRAQIRLPSFPNRLTRKNSLPSYDYVMSHTDAYTLIPAHGHKQEYMSNSNSCDIICVHL